MACSISQEIHRRDLLFSPALSANVNQKSTVEQHQAERNCRERTLLKLRIRQIAVFFSHGYFNGKTHSGTHADCSTGSPHSP
jgi:hypothetical protein